MKINATRKEHLEVEVSDLEVFNAFLTLIRRKLPYGLDLLAQNGELFFYEEVCGHNRDWETVQLKDRYPKTVVTKEMIALVKLLAEVKSSQGMVLGPPYC